MTQPAPGAAFRRALAAKCQGCLSRRLPPCPFLPYHPAGRLRAGRKPSPAFLALLPEVSGAGLSPRGSLLGALLGASLALASGETSPSLLGSPQGRCWPGEPCWTAHLWVPRAGRCRPLPLRFALRALRERNVASAHPNFSWQLPGGGYGCRVPWPKHRELASAAEAKQQTMNLGGIPVPIPAVGIRGDAPGRAPSLPSHYRSSRDLSKLWPAGEVPAAARRPCTALAGASLEGDGHCRTFALLGCLYILSPIKRSVLPNLSSGEWFLMFVLVPRGQNDVLSALCSLLVTLNQHKPAPFLVPVL